MKFTLVKPKINIVNLGRELNYSLQSKQKGSFVKSLRGRDFPRFHLFIEQNGNELNFKLHLDQKRASYGRETMKAGARPNAHSGEYDSKKVEQEAQRIKEVVKKLNN